MPTSPIIRALHVRLASHQSAAHTLPPQDQGEDHKLASLTLDLNTTPMKRTAQPEGDVRDRIVSANSPRVERLLTWSVLGRWLVLPLLAFTMTTAVFLPFARLGIDPYHDGVMLKPAL